MQRSKRFERFDPVTVGAATRVVRLGAARHLPEWEVRYYLRELALMEPGAGWSAHRRLWRLARRRAAVGCGGVQPSTGRHRCERVGVEPECLLAGAARVCSPPIR